MDGQEHIELAERFRAMHTFGRGPARSRPLLLPNAWDAGSARVVADLGAEAVATTSGGLAWALGYPDGEQAPLDEVLAVVRRIVRVCPVPVSVDFEAGYGDSPQAVAASVAAVIDTGAVGINLEDGIRHESLRGIEDAAARVAAARQAADVAGIPLVINARVDTFIVGGDASREELVEETVTRAQAYLAAGADCIYPIALADPDTIAALCHRIDAPVNIGARAGLPGLDELGRLGVARVSVGTRLATLALGAARQAASDMLATGGFDGLASGFGHDDAQRLFAPG